MLLAPAAKLLQLKFNLDGFLISRRLIVNVLAHGTLKLDEIILGHTIVGWVNNILNWSRRSDLNRRPSLYKSVALPLSYVGKL